MGLTQPLLLLAALGALVPVALHLWRRRPPPPTVFPAIELLLAGEARRARRRRLHDLALLLVRSAALGVLAVVLAGPTCSAPVPVPAVAGREQAAVIVLDDTFSLQVRRQGRPLFATAQARAAALLSVLPRTSPAALLTVTGQRGEVPELTLDRGRLDRALRGLAVTHRHGTLGPALARALASLAGAPPRHPPVVYVITDGTAAAGLPGPGALPPDVALVIIDVAEAPLPNRAVVRVARALVPDGKPGLAVAVDVLNATPQALTGLPVWLRVDDREVARVRLDVPAGAVRTATLRLPEGAGAGGAPLVTAGIPADDLPGDDQRVLPVGEPGARRVLLVDGDPRETRHEDELYYLEAALAALGSERQPLKVRALTGGEIAGAELEAEDVVVLANVRGVDARGVETLHRFVRRGGGLLLAAGDQLDVDAWNDGLVGRLLPGELRGVRASVQRLAPLEADSPLAAALADPATAAGLQEATVRRHLVLATSPDTGAVLLRLDSGTPLLAERRVGSGRVLLLGTTLDADWTDLPLRPVFLSLLQVVLDRLTGQGGPGPPRGVTVGDPVALPFEARDEALVVLGPGDTRTRIERPGSPDRAEVAFSATDRPGGYRVLAAGPGGAPADRPAAAFAVGVDPRESDLQRAAALPGQPGRVGASGARRQVALVTRDLSGWAAGLLLLLLLLEGLLAARLGSLRRR
jgi:hypothetical protein